LYDQGYFDPGAKIGLVRFDAPPFVRVSNSTLKPRLAAHGLKLTEEIGVATPQSTGDLGPMSSQLSNAILKLRSSDVDHVLFLDLGQEMSFFFFPQAESQGYRPRYGLSSYQGMNLMLANVPHQQFVNSVGVGFQPSMDMALANDPGGPALAPCKQAYADAGFGATNVGGANAVRGRSLYCDAFFFLKASYEKSASTTVSGLRVGADGLGTSFQATMPLGTQFGANRWDGAAVARGYTYFPDCECFKYNAMNRAM
jgi:hypothetical protein